MDLQLIIMNLITTIISGFKSLIGFIQRVLPQGLLGEGILLLVAFLLGWFLKGWFFKPKTKVLYVTIVLGTLIYLLFKMGMI